MSSSSSFLHLQLHASSSLPNSIFIHLILISFFSSFHSQSLNLHSFSSFLHLLFFLLLFLASCLLILILDSACEIFLHNFHHIFSFYSWSPPPLCSILSFNSHASISCNPKFPFNKFHSFSMTFYFMIVIIKVSWLFLTHKVYIYDKNTFYGGNG